MLPLNFREDFTKGLYIAGQNEVFVNLNDNLNGEQQGFGGNRLFVGPGYRFSPRFDLELGYLYEYRKYKWYGEIDHFIQLTTYLRL